MTETDQTAAAASTDPVVSFAGQNGAYYSREFAKIQGKTGFAWSWNTMAAVLGPLWGAARGVWGFFWVFLVLELFALVQLGRGLWGELGGDLIAKYERLEANIAKREQQAAELLAAGNADEAESKLRIAENLSRVAEGAREAAEAAASQATTILLTGILLFVAVKILEGFYANIAYEAQYLKWRAKQKVQSGVSRPSLVFGAVMLLVIWPLTLFRFTVSNPDEILSRLTGGFLGDTLSITKFPVDKEYFSILAKQGDAGFDWLATNFGDVFDGITAAIRAVLDGLEVVLIETPWPVVMVVITVMALRLAGPRVAIFTAASLAYLAFMGLWEISMITVALIGAGAFLCVLFGIPLGIWFGKSQRAYRFAEPVLDFMQTMPAFVYLIPVIAFFGTGKPAAIVATIIFGSSPVVRLTVLGLQGVPKSVREAAVAFGASKKYLLWKVDLPLAAPAIMAGINQTIMLSLAMVVIASLIGAKGLGEDVLEALQYASEGQGILAGLAILSCAMILDRIIQGRRR